MSTDDEIELQLGALSHRTAGVVPRADFAKRVMAAVEAEAEGPASSGFLGIGTWRMGWRVLPAAALAACAALVLAVQSSSSYDDALVSTYDESTVELSW